MTRPGPAPRKRRARQHVFTDQSANYVERFIIDEGHTTQRLAKDYGYGLMLFTYDEQGYVEPGLTFLSDKVLRALGFSCRTVTLQTEAVVYEHQATGAVIILPAAPERKTALAHHLAAAQGTLTAFGIADPLDLAGELQKAS